MKYLRTLACFSILAACGGTAIFSDIGTNMSNPLSVAVDSTNQVAYVVNSNDQFNYTGGSIHIVNLADETAPARLDSVAINSFGSQLYLDTANSTLYLPNRYSEHDDVTSDALLSVSVASNAFGTVVSTATGVDPFGAVANAAGDTLYVPTRDDTVDVFDISGATPSRSTQLSLLVSLDDGGTHRIASAVQAVLINNGTQLVVTRDEGGLFVINVSEIGVSGKNPVDYFIDDIIDPRGIARLGDATSTTILVSDLAINDDGAPIDSVYQLDLASLTVVPDNTTAAVKDKEDDSLIVGSALVVGTTLNESDDIQEIVVRADAQRAYLSVMDNDRIAVLDVSGAAPTLESYIEVGEEPFGMAFYQKTPGSDTHLLVCNRVSNTVSIIDLDDNSIVGTYPQ